MKKLLVAALLAAFAVGLSPGRVSADTPDQYGWWSTLSASRPDVPPDGLLIEGGIGTVEGAKNTSPTSFSALVYQIPAGATVGKLTLAVAEGSATVPNAKLQLCSLSGATLQAAQGGPMSGAPKFDCNTYVTTTPSSDGSTYEFDVSSLVSGTILAVAVLPTTPADRVVLGAPGTDSLAVDNASGSGPVGDDSSAPTSEFSTPNDDYGGSLLTDGVSVSSPSLPTVDAAAEARRSNGQASPVRSGLATAAPIDASEAATDNPVALLLLLAGAAVFSSVWLTIGRLAGNRVGLNVG